MRTLLSVVAVSLLSLVARTHALDGTLIVLNKAEASASLINLATGEEVKRVSTGQGPHEVAVSPDGRVAVVADYGAGEAGSTLTVIDVVKGEKLSTIDLGDFTSPHGITFLDGQRVIVTTEGADAVVIADVTSSKVVQTISTEQKGSHMVAVTPDGTRAFTANIGSNSVTALDLKAGEIIKQIETGKQAEGIDISPDGSEVWVSNRAGNTVSVIDADSLEILEQIDCGDFPIRVKFTPDGRHVLVSNARSGEVAVFDAASREEIARIAFDAPGADGEQVLGSGGPVPIGILVSPDGEKAYVAATNADMIGVIEIGSWTQGEPLKAGKEPDGMAYSALTVGVEQRPSGSKTYGN